MKKQLFLLTFFLFTSRIGHAQFIDPIVPYTWKSPLVQGHSLKNARFLDDNRLIAVGDQGTIMMSHDTGATWIIYQIPTISNFRSVCATDSLTFYVAGGEQNGRGQIYKTTDGGQQWNLLFDTIPWTFHAIHFPTDSIGYVAGNIGRILKTTDAGNSWTPLVTGNVSNYVCMQFLNADTGFVGGTNYGMYKTTNGGISWSLVNSFPETNCYSIKFLNDTLGWASAYSGKIYKTFNGGLTWQQQLNQANFEKITQFSFNSPTRGIAVSDAYFYKTNNGTTWTATFAYAGMNMKCVALNNNSTIFIGADGGGMRMAQNFTNTYTNTNTGFGLASNRCIKFVDPLNGWVCGDNGRIGKTSDGGNTWLFDTANFFSNFNDLAAISPQKAIAVGSNGEVITTINGLQSLTTQVMNSTNTLQAIDFPSATTGYIAGLGGVMYKTINGGTSWTSINTGITDDITDLCFLNNNVGFFLGQAGYLKKTINGGSTWTDADPSFVFSPFYAMHWIDEFIGMVIDNNGYVARTNNGGQNWSIVDTVCSGNSFDIMFIDANRGFTVGDATNAFCDVSYTTDGGLSWDGLSLPYKYAISSIFAFDTSNFFLTGPYQSIIQAGSSIVTEKIDKPMDEISSLSVYPNPSSGQITIENYRAKPFVQKGNLYDLSGRNCASFAIPANIKKIDLNIAHLEKGFYMIIIENQSQKIVLD
jgi:photosystem II stability/assembly factor-like uncharacterized protein